MLCLIYDYREICWFKPVVGLPVRPSTFPSAFVLVSQVDYIPTYLSLLLSACLSYFYVHTIFHSTVSLSLRLSVRSSTFHLPFILSLRLPFTTIYLSLCLSACLSGCLYICLPFSLPACFFSDCLLSIYPYILACFSLSLPAPKVEGEGVDCSLYMYI